jgi:hypothetical protein
MAQMFRFEALIRACAPTMVDASTSTDGPAAFHDASQQTDTEPLHKRSVLEPPT